MKIKISASFTKYLLGGVFLFLLTGCVSYPNVVSVPEHTPLVEFETVNQVDVNKLGEKARWSGVIANIKNGKKNTSLDVLYYPAQAGGRPNTTKEPMGRFRVYVHKFLDPAVYKKGKQITVLGTLKSKETNKIGEYEYEYPTLDDAVVFLWPKPKEFQNLHYRYDYGWHGIHPKWYWRGGARHLYVVGINKKPVIVKNKSKTKTK